MGSILCRLELGREVDGVGKTYLNDGIEEGNWRRRMRNEERRTKQRSPRAVVEREHCSTVYELQSGSLCTRTGPGRRSLLVRGVDQGKRYEIRQKKATNTCSSRKADGSRRGLAAAAGSTSTTTKMVRLLVVVLSVHAILVIPE